MQGKIHFRDEDKIYNGHRYGGRSGNKTAIPSHQLYDGHTIIGTRSLVMGIPYYRGRHIKSGFKAKRFIQKIYVVVDGFRYSYDRDIDTAPFDLLGDGVGSF